MITSWSTNLGKRLFRVSSFRDGPPTHKNYDTFDEARIAAHKHCEHLESLKSADEDRLRRVRDYEQRLKERLP